MTEEDVLLNASWTQETDSEAEGEFNRRPSTLHLCSSLSCKHHTTQQCLHHLSYQMFSWMLRERRRLIVRLKVSLTEGGRALYISVLLCPANIPLHSSVSIISAIRCSSSEELPSEAVQNKSAFGTCLTRKYYFGISVYFTMSRVFSSARR